MKPTIVTIGNGGFNIAADCIKAGIFSDCKLIVCDTDAEDLKRNSVSADCSFLLDCSILSPSPKYITRLSSIVAEVTDQLFLITALGGMTSRIYVPLMAMAMETPGRLIWSIFTMPFDYEGEEVSQSARHTCQYLLAFTDMLLVLRNNRLSPIPGLTVGDMNKPITDTLAGVTLSDVRRTIRYTKSYAEYVPEKYREIITLYRSPLRYPAID